MAGKKIDLSGQDQELEKLLDRKILGEFCCFVG